MKRILFVEDDPVVIAVYRNRLEREGFNIEVAEDGLVAMRSLATTKPDLVILDLMLPKVNGLEILKYIRGNTRLGAVPVIVLSNAYLPDMVKQAMLAGANKPMFKSQCTPATLLKVIRSFLPEPGGNGEEEAQLPGVGKGAAKDSISRPEEGLDLNMMLRARAEFLESAPAEMTHIRELCVAYIKNSHSATGLTLLENLYQRVHFISARAGLIGLSRIAILAGAFEAVLFEIVLRPASATKSLFHTIAQATDCLRRLIEHADTDSVDALLDAKVLVVDDDGVCNHIMVQALRRVNLKAVGVKDPVDAIRLLQNDKFDLVLLDIMMPGMDGFDVCKQLRSFSHQRTTPVIFVTANAEFENRVKSILSGGNELIAKPISPMELALKAITILLDSKIAKPQEAQPGAAVATPSLPEQRMRPPVEDVRPRVDLEARPVEQPPQEAEPVPVASVQEATAQEQVEPAGPVLGQGQVEEVTPPSEIGAEQSAQPTAEPAPDPLAEAESPVELTGTEQQVAPEEILTDEKAGAELMARLSAPETVEPPPETIKEITPLSLGEMTHIEEVTESVGSVPGAIEPPAEAKVEPAQVDQELAEPTAETTEVHEEPVAESEKPAEEVTPEPVAEPLAEEPQIKFEEPVLEPEPLQTATASVQEEPVQTGPVAPEPAAVEPVAAEAVGAEAGGAEPVQREASVAESAPVESVVSRQVAPEAVGAESVETQPVQAETAAAEPSAVEHVVPEPVQPEPTEPTIPPTEAVVAPEPQAMPETPEPVQVPESVESLEQKPIEFAAEEPVQVMSEAEQFVRSDLPKPETEESRLLEALIAEMNLTVNQNTMPMEKEKSQVLDKIAVAVARIIFGEDKLTELNVRLVRIALERYNIPELLGLADK